MCSSTPKESLIDQNSGVLTTDAAVRLYPETDLGDLQYPKGKAPAQVATTIVAHGDPGNWPFDTYTTDEISGRGLHRGLPKQGMGPYRSDRIVGRLGCERPSRPRRRGHREPGQPRQRGHHVAQVKGAADLRPGNLPDTYRLARCWHCGWPFRCCWAGRRSCHRSSRGTARCCSPSSRCATSFPVIHRLASWIDQAVVLWVLIGLVVAMALFILAWWRHRDRKQPKKT